MGEELQTSEQSAASASAKTGPVTFGNVSFAAGAPTVAQSGTLVGTGGGGPPWAYIAAGVVLVIAFLWYQKNK